MVQRTGVGFKSMQVLDDVEYQTRRMATLSYNLQEECRTVALFAYRPGPRLLLACKV